MALAMARPWKHPKTGFFWIRKRVPADLVPVLNRREEKRTLGTRDPVEAKRRHAEALSEIERRWAELRKSVEPRPEPEETNLSEREAHRMAEWLHGYWLNFYRENPSEQTFWRTDLFDRLWREPSLLESYGLPEHQLEDRIKIDRLEKWCLDHADDTLHVRDLIADEGSRLKLAKALAAAAQRASITIARWARGEFDEARAFEAAAVPREHAMPVSTRGTEALIFDALFDGWAAEKQPVEKTKYAGRRTSSRTREVRWS